MEKRTEIAAMAMQGILANSETDTKRMAQRYDTGLTCEYGEKEAAKKYAESVAFASVSFADALILTLDEDYGEWNRYSKKEMWEEIQKVRKLVGSDGTQTICEDIKSYAECYKGGK